MGKIEIYFTADLGRPGFVPRYFFRTDNHDGIYNIIDSKTGSTELAIEVASWAELAGIGEEFDHELLHAEIIDEEA